MLMLMRTSSKVTAGRSFEAAYAALRAFRAEHAEVDLVLRVEPTGVLLDALRDGQLDLTE